jgi:hypothetical protein
MSLGVASRMVAASAAFVVTYAKRRSVRSHGSARQCPSWVKMRPGGERNIWRKADVSEGPNSDIRQDLPATPRALHLVVSRRGIHLADPAFGGDPVRELRKKRDEKMRSSSGPSPRALPDLDIASGASRGWEAKPVVRHAGHIEAKAIVFFRRPALKDSKALTGERAGDSLPGSPNGGRNGFHRQGCTGHRRR